MLPRAESPWGPLDLSIPHVCRRGLSGDESEARGRGSGSAKRAPLLQSFCEEAAVSCAARPDGRIDDAEARQIAGAAGRLYTEIEEPGKNRARE